MERTDQLAARLGISLRALAPVVGVSVASLFGYRSGTIPISNKAWSKLEQAEREEKAGENAKMSEDVKHYGIGETAQSVLAESRTEPSAVRNIPVVGWAHAGDAGSYEELPYSWRDAVPSACPDKKAFAVRLEGDSMEPKFSEGDLLIVQPTTEAHSGCFVVARFVDDGVIFRRIEITGQTIRMIPLNERYPVTEHQASEFSWIYPVFARITTMWRR